MKRLQVSAHTLMSAADCRTRTLLHLAGMKDAGLPVPGAQLSMEAGTQGHKAMAAWLNGSDWVEAIAPYEQRSDELGILEDRRGHANLSLILREVFSRYTPQSNLPFELLTPQTTEVSFVAPLGVLRDGTPVDLIGYIDKLVQDKRTGLKLPLEHKFTGKLDESFVRRFTEYDPQVTAYMFAAETVLGEKIGDAWVNAVEVAKVPQSTRKCTKHGVLYEECGPLHVKQTFIAARRTPEQLKEFRVRALEICNEYLLPVANALAKKGVEVATKTPRDGPFTGACDYCEFARWCLTSNRAPNLMQTMLAVDARDDTRLRSGFVEA